MIPKEGDTVKFNKFFLAALRNNTFMEDFQGNLEEFQASQYYPYRYPGPKFWEDTLTVETVEKKKEGFRVCVYRMDGPAKQGTALVLNQDGEIIGNDLDSCIRRSTPFRVE
jgi:hypothetical protein